jgi:hypothetical protein
LLGLFMIHYKHKIPIFINVKVVCLVK